MIAIRSYDNYIFANLQKSLLLNAGIYCYLKDENVVTIDPFLSPAIGGMKLMVNKLDVEAANNVLEAAEQAFLETLTCNACGQKTIQKVVSKKTFHTVWKRFWSMLKNGQPVEYTTIYKCYSCGCIQDNL